MKKYKLIKKINKKIILLYYILVLNLINFYTNILAA